MTPTALHRLTLTNFRLFERLQVDLHPELTVLVAANGAGKSTVLAAARLALGGAFAPMLGSAQGVGLGDVRRVWNAELGTMELALPTTLHAEATLAGTPMSWELARDSAKPRSVGFRREALTSALVATVNLVQAVREHAEGKRVAVPELPLVAYFGTSRAWDDTVKPRRSTSPATSRLQAYAGALDDAPGVSFFTGWFRELHEAAVLESVSGTPSPHRPAEKLTAVRHVIQTVMYDVGWTGLFWDPLTKEVLSHHPDLGHLPVRWLSDGLVSVLWMAADLAHRCCRLNPQLGHEAPAHTTGVVLIDEIDLHLHPAWQQVILERLREAFPKLQFIVTTHSPAVLSTVKAESIRVLTSGPDGATCITPTQETQGSPAPDVLLSVMGVDPAPDLPIRDDLNRYRALIDNGAHESEAGVQLRAVLTDHFGPAHPEILDLDRLIRFRRALHLRNPEDPSAAGPR